LPSKGSRPRAVDVQVQIGPGLPAFTIVGLPDKAVAESRERVRGALNAIGLALPPKRITVNLAPADLPKEGSHYDLPIALGLMAAVGAVAHDAIEGYCVLGELALDGSIAAVAGALPAAIGANALGKGLVCPQASGAEAAWAAAEMSILAPSNLRRAGEPGFACRQGRGCAERYQARISGPLLDRIDLQIEVPAVSAADLVLPAASEGSAEVRARVAAARRIQMERLAALRHPRARTNADCDGNLLEEIAAPDQAGRTLLREAADALSLSARGYHRTLRVARTLADLDGEERVARIHIAEALSYRGETLRRAQAAA
jgi:predicted ATPase with chaperone activity